VTKLSAGNAFAFHCATSTVKNYLARALRRFIKKKYKESLGEQSYRLDDLANNNTKRHSILARQILVFKTKYADSGRKDDSG
jgi:hypothetical protein